MNEENEEIIPIYCRLAQNNKLGTDISNISFLISSFLVHVPSGRLHTVVVLCEICATTTVVACQLCQ